VVCNSIINEMLEYTRGRRSHTFLAEVNPWLNEVLDDIDNPQGIPLERNLAGDLPAVYYDGEKLRSVVVNLVQNSFHAVMARSNDNGETEIDYSPAVAVSTSEVPMGVLIVVEDNGIGMDHDTKARAFEPLFTAKARGTGLGLSIVHKVIEEHGSEVDLRTAEESGTRISFVLHSERTDSAQVK
ncbi:ATP-binding protein, partial [Thermodesulfobacteriota bacterium]